MVIVMIPFFPFPSAVLSNYLYSFFSKYTVNIFTIPGSKPSTGTRCQLIGDTEVSIPWKKLSRNRDNIVVKCHLCIFEWCLFPRKRCVAVFWSFFCLFRGFFFVSLFGFFFAVVFVGDETDKTKKLYVLFHMQGYVLWTVLTIQYSTWIQSQSLSERQQSHIKTPQLHPSWVLLKRSE